MGYFTTDQANRLSAAQARIGTLVDLEFSGSPAYIWNGFGTRVFGGKSYIGVGDFGSIEGLEDIRNAESQQVMITLSGVPDSVAELLPTALSNIDIIQGNIAVVSMQLFDADWAAVGDPIPIYFGLMQLPRVVREPATEVRGATRKIMLPAENVFYGRHRPAAGRYTDAEQQRRFPDDLFCEATPELANKTIIWPDY